METPNIFDRGVAKVKNVVSEVSIEQREFMKAFVRMGHDGWLQGWHESNGGNLSYRMTQEEVSACRSYFNEVPAEWVPLGLQAQGLHGEYFVVTGSGMHFRNISMNPSSQIGIIEINQLGDAWRLVWGLKNNATPTSEFKTHFLAHAVRKGVTENRDRVVYHAHPSKVIATTSVIPNDSRIVTRALWKSLTESIVVVPQGIGVTATLVPGSEEIAIKTSSILESQNTVVWPHHGILCCAPDFNDAFGIMHTVEKAADIYLLACIAHGSPNLSFQPSDNDIRAIAKRFKVNINEGFLD